MRVIDRGSPSFCCANTNSTDGSQACDGGRAVRLMIELLLDMLYLADEPLDPLEEGIPPQLL
jgi:hypothetical protein